MTYSPLDRLRLKPKRHSSALWATGPYFELSRRKASSPFFGATDSTSTASYLSASLNNFQPRAETCNSCLRGADSSSRFSFIPHEAPSFRPHSPQSCVLSHVTFLKALCQFHVGNDFSITNPTYSTFCGRSLSFPPKLRVLPLVPTCSIKKAVNCDEYVAPAAFPYRARIPAMSDN
jgi:hypothetical protein